MNSTRTIHVSLSGKCDRGDLYALFRQCPGYDLSGFYQRYLFIRFTNPVAAFQTIQAFASHPGISSIVPAKHEYSVPYPQPDDSHHAPSGILHVTHLPADYSKAEVLKIFQLFIGFQEAHLYGKYCYVYFDSTQCAYTARCLLRKETNLVVSFAKSPPTVSQAMSPLSIVKNPNYVFSESSSRVPKQPKEDLYSEPSVFSQLASSFLPSASAPSYHHHSSGKSGLTASQSHPEFLSYSSSHSAVPIARKLPLSNEIQSSSHYSRNSFVEGDRKSPYVPPSNEIHSSSHYSRNSFVEGDRKLSYAHSSNEIQSSSHYSRNSFVEEEQFTNRYSESQGSRYSDTSSYLDRLSQRMSSYSIHNESRMNAPSVAPSPSTHHLNEFHRSATSRLSRLISEETAGHSSHSFPDHLLHSSNFQRVKPREIPSSTYSTRSHLSQLKPTCIVPPNSQKSMSHLYDLPHSGSPDSPDTLPSPKDLPHSLSNADSAVSVTSIPIAQRKYSWNPLLYGSLDFGIWGEEDDVDPRSASMPPHLSIGKSL